MQLLHVVDKSEKFIDELLHTDIRMKSAAVNDPAVDFGACAVCCLLLLLTHAPRAAVFERFEPRLAKAGIEHRINVLRCSQAARSVGDVVVANAQRIKASLVVVGMGPKSAVKEALLGSVANRVTHRCSCPVLVVRGLES